MSDALLLLLTIYLVCVFVSYVLYVSTWFGFYLHRFGFFLFVCLFFFFLKIFAFVSLVNNKGESWSYFSLFVGSLGVWRWVSRKNSLWCSVG